ncbi:MAG: hxuB 1 [Firmicutes bacterium]|nr:hxuB 1 [Bacillota bacterium]
MKKQRLKPATALLAAYMLLPTCTALAAPIDAGSVLRDSQQTERKLPERQIANVIVAKEIKQPMINDQGFKMFVKSYRISGQDVLDNDELTKLLVSYTNQEMTMQSLQEAASILTKYFRDRGYFVAQAYLPVQEINEDTVEIAVLVGRCGDIILRNQSAVPDAIIMEQLKAIKSGAYIHTDIMERAALLASDLPGISARTTLIPGNLPGTTDIVVEAKPKGEVWQGNISENNWGSRLTGYNQTTLNLILNNPLKRGDSITASFNTAGAGQQTGNIGYHIPLGEGSTLNVNYAKANYELGKDMASLDVYGTAYTKHADWTYALRRSRDSNYSVQLGYDHKWLEDKIGSQSTTTEKWSHATSIGVIGDSTDNMLGGGMNSYSLIWYTGNIGGRTDAGTTLTTGNWEKTTFNVMRQQYLRERLSLFLSFSGQFANTNLDSSEKFSLGGANGVRAYPSGEASGDEAWLGTAELRYTLPANSNGAMWQLATFYDAGTSRLEKNQITPGQNSRSLRGAGLGISYIMPGSYAIKANYAWRAGSEDPQSDSTFGKGRLWLQGVRYF